ncbi:MAG: hypothetical protein KAT39_02350 [Alphaproteobacteria bacterium]|nr:hypothetical protein [Alphaproteobacteria bacterium]
MARILCALTGVLLGACSAATTEGRQTADNLAKPTPPEFVEQVQRAEVLGHAIFQKDILAARATDAFLADGSPSRKAEAGGWATVADGENRVVYFFDQSQRNPAIIQEINFPDSSGKNPELREPGSRPALEKIAVAMFRARRAAEKAKYQACSQTYNSVVLPADLAGEEGWYVYLLAATTKRNAVVLGGHIRVHVSTDGKKILNVKEFTKTCLTILIPDNAAGITVTHIVDKHPVETHVFMSLLYGMPLYIGISPNTWAVENGLIRLVSR